VFGFDRGAVFECSHKKLHALSLHGNWVSDAAGRVPIELHRNAKVSKKILFQLAFMP
jgi:hypothetical protein